MGRHNRYGAGLALIGLTSGRDGGAQPDYAVAALIAIECGVLVVGVAIAVPSIHRRVPPAAQGLLLGATAGALFGVSDIAIKFLVDDTASGVLELISPWTAAALIASVVAFYTSARALQIGPGVEVIALTSAAFRPKRLSATPGFNPHRRGAVRPAIRPFRSDHGHRFVLGTRRLSS